MDLPYNTLALDRENIITIDPISRKMAGNGPIRAKQATNQPIRRLDCSHVGGRTRILELGGIF